MLKCTYFSEGSLRSKFVQVGKRKKRVQGKWRGR